MLILQEVIKEIISTRCSDTRRHGGHNVVFCKMVHFQKCSYSPMFENTWFAITKARIPICNTPQNLTMTAEDFLK